jgi:glycosyltransferase involved in cell wall biosynthesis
MMLAPIARPAVIAVTRARGGLCRIEDGAAVFGHAAARYTHRAMTRVLFVAESFYPVLGGGERHIQDLSAALAADGVETMVLTRRGRREWPREEMLGGARVLRVGPSGPGRIGKYAMLPNVVAAMWRERERYDVVNVCGTRVLGLPVLLAAHALGKAVALQADMTGELTGEIYVWGTPFHRPFVLRLLAPALALRNALLRRAEVFVAISQLIERECLDAGFRPEQVVCIQHAADTARFRPAAPGEARALRVRLGLPPDGGLITFTGRLLKGKGLDILVEAFARVAADHAGAHLAILGSGAGQVLSVEDALRADVERRGLASRVTFTGRVDNVEEYLRASDIFAFPSLYEGLPHSPLEAAASGLAAVASRTGGIPDVVVHEDTGLLVEPGDVDGVTLALRRLLDDAPLRARLGRRARELALERFSLAAVSARYRQLFERLARPTSATAAR